MKIKKIKETIALILIMGVLFFAGCTNQAPTTTTTPSTTTPQSVGIAIVQTSSGMMVKDDSGMTLYTFDNDGIRISNCNDHCALLWQPLLAQGSLNVIPGDIMSDITTFQRVDGTTQVAYKGKPLYYYSGDINLGDTKGDGIAGLWHVATVANAYHSTSTTTITTVRTTNPVTVTTLVRAPHTVYVTIDALDFDPRWQTVVVGDTVVWTNKQQSQMTITSSDNTTELNSQTLGPTDMYSHTFNKVGTYTYYSKIHTQAVGTIHVLANRSVSNPTTGDINSAMGESSAGEPGITNSS